MLIDRVMSFCDSEYRNAHKNTRCEDCLHTGDCSRNCKDCLEEIHYPSRHPNGKKFYDCPHLINFYVCDYAYKYATEIYYLLQKSDALAEIEHYSIFSSGCGACPDLMAFELYLQRNAPGKTLEYRGIDKNPLWESIHNQVLQYTTADITYINLSTEDAFTFLEQFAVGDINVLVLQYIISALYVSKGPCAVDKLFDLIIDSIVKHKNASEPFVILVNDVNSNNMGRDLFLSLVTKLQLAGFRVSYDQYYFDKNIQVEAQRYGTRHEKSVAMNEATARRYCQYEPWQFCTSAQLLIEIGGDDE